MNEHDILHQFLYTGGSILLGLTGVGIKSLTSAWASKVRNQTLAQVIRNTDDVVMHVVKSIYQTHVRPRTRHNKELSQHQQRHIRQVALQEIKQHLGRQALKELDTSFGPDVDTVLRHHLEAAIQDIKYQRSGTKEEDMPQDDTLLQASDRNTQTAQHPTPPSGIRSLSRQTTQDAWETQQADELKRMQHKNPTPHSTVQGKTSPGKPA